MYADSEHSSCCPHQIRPASQCRPSLRGVAILYRRGPDRPFVADAVSFGTVSDSSECLQKPDLQDVYPALLGTPRSSRSAQWHRSVHVQSVGSAKELAALHRCACGRYLLYGGWCTRPVARAHSEFSLRNRMRRLLSGPVRSPLRITIRIPYANENFPKRTAGASPFPTTRSGGRA